MASNTHHSGTVKDPEHDGRLKENREAGRTKGTTPGSAERAQEHGHQAVASSHSTASHSSGSHSPGSHSSGSHGSGGHSGTAHPGGSASSEGDLKSREYTDKDGQVHHHTRASGKG